MKMQPRDVLLPLRSGREIRRWQGEAVLAVRRYLREHRSVLISAATGTGKGDLLAGLILKAAWANRRCLFLVHRDDLIEDVMSRTVAMEPALYAGKVKGQRNEIDRQTVFASVQSLHRKRLGEMAPFDFVFTDESHHAEAKTYKAIYDRVFALNRNARHVGMTATPFRSAGGGKTSGLGAVFDALIYEYPLHEAITEGVLSPVRGIRIETELDLSGVDPDDEKRVEAMVNTPDRNRVVVEKYLEHVAGKQGIGFCASVDHAVTLAAMFQASGVRADAVWEVSKIHGKDKRRDEKILAYKEGRLDVLICRDLLAEGFDAPATSAVLLARPTASRGLFAQMVGRVTRLHPGKVEGLVLDFVGNSSTHSLASFSDLTTPGKRPRIEVGAVVRHRRRAELDEGVVMALRAEGEEDCAVVEWRGHGQGTHPCDDLVLLRPPREALEVLIAPDVIGVNEFKIQLFGGRKIGWYTYESSKGKVMVARGRNESALLRRVGDVWEAWHRSGDTVTLLGVGSFGDAESLVQIDAAPWNRDWQRDPATDGQVETLRKFNVRRPNLSKGEASMLIELKIVVMLIGRDVHSAMAAK